MRASIAVVALLLPLCLGPPPPPAPETTGNSASPQTAATTRPFDDAEEGTHPLLPGVRTYARLFEDGSSRRVAAEAQNGGPSSYYVRTMCYYAWADHLYDADNRSFQREEPILQCQGFGYAPFSPGHRLAFESWWNGTRWNEDAERVEPVAPGTYRWSVSFEAFRESGQWPGDVIWHNFTITVP